MTDNWTDRPDEKQHTDEREHERLDNIRIQERQDNVEQFQFCDREPRPQQTIVTIERLEAIYAQILIENEIKRQRAIIKWVQNHQHLLEGSETK